MSKARSPQYPAIGLKEAIAKIGSVYAKDYQNKTTRDVIAKHMGYDSLHGKALGVLSALAKYGLMLGRGEENYVSDLAVEILAHPKGSPERANAIKEAAAKPELFSELDSRFNGGKGSDTAIRSYLLTNKFIPSAADSVIRSYRETKDLVQEEVEGYSGGENEEPEMPRPETIQATAQLGARSSLTANATVLRRAVFTLDEGDVTIQFPADLSHESVADLRDYLETFMKRLSRDDKDKEAAN